MKRGKKRCSAGIIQKRGDKINPYGKDGRKAGLIVDTMMSAKTGRQMNVLLKERGILPIFQ